MCVCDAHYGFTKHCMSNALVWIRNFVERMYSAIHRLHLDYNLFNLQRQLRVIEISDIQVCSRRVKGHMTFDCLITKRKCQDSLHGLPLTELLNFHNLYCRMHLSTWSLFLHGTTFWIMNCSCTAITNIFIMMIERFAFVLYWASLLLLLLYVLKGQPWCCALSTRQMATRFRKCMSNFRWAP